MNGVLGAAHRPVHAYRQKPGNRTVLIMFIASLVAVALGLVAFTASPLLIAAVVAIGIAPAMLLMPAFNVWAVLAAGLLVAGLLPIWAEGAAAKMAWAVSGLGLLLALRAAISALVDPALRRHTPMFVWLAFAAVVLFLANSLLQYSSLYELLSGFKRYFQVFGLLFALAWLPFSHAQIRRWLRFFMWVAVIQVPWVLYQRISLVPLREGIKAFHPGMVPVDVVAGTFGSPRMGGGANAEMATFLLIVLVFLLSRWRHQLLRLRTLQLLLPLILLPLFMGETKIVVVFLPLLLLLLFRSDLFRRPVIALIWLAVGAVLTIGSAVTYLAMSDKSVDRQIYETVEYNFHSAGYGNLYLNRTTAVTFWARRQSLGDPVGALIGHGLGTAHMETGGYLSQRYFGYGIGLTAASALLWEQGLLGLGLYLALLVAAWLAAAKLCRKAEPWIRADAAAIQVTLPVFGLYLLYRSTPIDLLTFQIVWMGLLGYLAWLVRFAAQPTRPPGA